MDSKIIAFAIESHNKVNHLYDGKPYSVHLSMVAIYATKYIDCLPMPTNIISACWLHDTIEDCRLTYNDIVKISNKEIAELVYAVTNEKGKTRSERANEKYYSEMLKMPYARFIKLCDRLANVLYGKQNNSTMFGNYAREHKHFLQSLFPDGNYAELKPLVLELNEMLGYVNGVPLNDLSE